MVFFRAFFGGQQQSLKAQLSMATISWQGKVDWEQNGRQENVFFPHNDQPAWKNEAVTPWGCLGHLFYKEGNGSRPVLEYVYV